MFYKKKLSKITGFYVFMENLSIQNIQKEKTYNEANK